MYEDNSQYQSLRLVKVKIKKKSHYEFQDNESRGKQGVEPYSTVKLHVHRPLKPVVITGTAYPDCLKAVVETKCSNEDLNALTTFHSCICVKQLYIPKGFRKPAYNI